MLNNISAVFKDLPKQQHNISVLFRRRDEKITEQLLNDIESFTNNLLNKKDSFKEPLSTMADLFSYIVKAKISSYRGEYDDAEDYVLKARNTYYRFDNYQKNSKMISSLVIDVLENQIYLQKFIKEADTFILDKLDETDEFSTAFTNNDDIYYQKLISHIPDKDIYAYYNSNDKQNPKLILQGFTNTILSHELKEERRVFFNKTEDLQKRISDVIHKLSCITDSKKHNKEKRKYIVDPNILYKNVLETQCLLNFYYGSDEPDSLEVLHKDLKNKVKLHATNMLLNKDTINEFKGEFVEEALRKKNHKYINFYVKSLDRIIHNFGNSVFLKSPEQLAESLLQGEKMENAENKKPSIR